MNLVGAYSGSAPCGASGFDAFEIDLPSLQVGDLIVSNTTNTTELTQPSSFVYLSYKVYSVSDSFTSIHVPAAINVGVGWALVFRDSEASFDSALAGAYSDLVSDQDCADPYDRTSSVDGPVASDILRVQGWVGFLAGAPPVYPTGEVNGAQYKTDFISNNCFISNGTPPCAPQHNNGLSAMSFGLGTDGTISSTFTGIGHITATQDGELRFGVAAKPAYGWGVLLGSS